MAGRRQFDEDAVLDRAMTAFWLHGFEATSVSDLEQATGLNKSSLYNAFGSKEALFARCLDRFGAEHGARLVGLLHHPDLMTGLGQFFNALAERMVSGTVPRGCLATMAASELGGGDTALGARIGAGLEEMRLAFANRFRRAQADGVLAPDADVTALATAALALTRGLAVLSRGHPDPDAVRAGSDGALALFKAVLDRPAS